MQPNNSERTIMNSRQKKPPQKPKLHIVASDGNPSVPKKAPGSPTNQIPKKISQAHLDAHREQMKRASGTEQQALQVRLLFQAVNAISDVVGQEVSTLKHVQEALIGIAPRDELEGMIAVQIVTLHSLIMDCITLTTNPKQTDSGVDAYANRTAKLIRAFTALTEALSRYRSKGQQKMTVEHVHVHPGGRAIVGQVSQKNTQIKGNGTNGK
jgi:hypothetical protein